MQILESLRKKNSHDSEKALLLCSDAGKHLGCTFQTSLFWGISL